MGRIECDVADVRAAIAEEAERKIAVRSDERTLGACHGAGLRPGNSAIGRLQNARAKVNVETDGSLFAGSGINCTRTRCWIACGWGKSDGAHCQRRILIALGSPGLSRVGRAPDAALGGANWDSISGGFAAVPASGLYS